MRALIAVTRGTARPHLSNRKQKWISGISSRAAPVLADTTHSLALGTTALLSWQSPLSLLDGNDTFKYCHTDVCLPFSVYNIGKKVQCITVTGPPYSPSFEVGGLVSLLYCRYCKCGTKHALHSSVILVWSSLAWFSRVWFGLVKFWIFFSYAA